MAPYLEVFKDVRAEQVRPGMVLFDPDGNRLVVDQVVLATDGASALCYPEKQDADAKPRRRRIPLGAHNRVAPDDDDAARALGELGDLLHRGLKDAANEQRARHPDQPTEDMGARLDGDSVATTGLQLTTAWGWTVSFGAVTLDCDTHHDVDDVQELLD